LREQRTMKDRDEDCSVGSTTSQQCPTRKLAADLVTHVWELCYCHLIKLDKLSYRERAEALQTLILLSR